MSQTILYSIEENFTGPVQDGLASVGIDSYWKAGLFFSALTATALYAAKPAAFYNKDGSVRPWNVGQDGTNAKMTGATPVPLWLASLSTGYIFAAFI